MGQSLSTFKSQVSPGWHLDVYRAIDAMINEDMSAAKTICDNATKCKFGFHNMHRLYVILYIASSCLVGKETKMFLEFMTQLRADEVRDVNVERRDLGQEPVCEEETFKPLDEICKKKSSWGKLMQAVNRGDSNMVKLLLTDVNHKQAFELWIKGNRQKYADFFLDENLPLYRAAYKGYYSILKTLLDSLGPYTIKLLESQAFVNSMGQCLAGRSESLPLLELLFNITYQHSKSDTGVGIQETIQKAYAIWIFHCALGICDSRVMAAILQKKSVDGSYLQVISDLCKCAAVLGIDTNTIIRLAERIPQAELIKSLTEYSEFKADKNFHYCFLSPFLFYRLNGLDGSTLGVLVKEDNITLMKALLELLTIRGCSDRIMEQLTSCIRGNSAYITRAMIDLCECFLHMPSFVISGKVSYSRLQMHGLVCYNDFIDCAIHQERTAADDEATKIKSSLKSIGVNLSDDLKNWSRSQLIITLKEFCQKIKSKCSVAWLCVMSHGAEGIIYDFDRDAESPNFCQLNEIFTILHDELPVGIPKVTKLACNISLWQRLNIQC